MLGLSRGFDVDLCTVFHFTWLFSRYLVIFLWWWWLICWTTRSATVAVCVSSLFSKYTYSEYTFYAIVVCVSVMLMTFSSFNSHNIKNTTVLLCTLFHTEIDFIQCFVQLAVSNSTRQCYCTCTYPDCACDGRDRGRTAILCSCSCYKLAEIDKTQETRMHKIILDSLRQWNAD